MKEKAVNHRDIAKILGINQATVSRALSSDRSHTVAPATRQKIAQVANELGYRTDINARRISCKRSESLTFVVDNIDHKYSDCSHEMLLQANNAFQEVFYGAICEATANGYDIKMLPLHQNIDAPENYIKERIGYPYSDGVIFYGMFYRQELRQWLREKNFPYSVIQVFENGLTEPPFIINDHVPGYRKMFDFFKKNGIRKVVYSNIQMTTPAHQLYFDRFCRIMAETDPGIEVVPYFVNDYFEFRMTSGKVLDQILQGQTPAALVSMTPVLSVLWTTELKTRNLTPGEDILLAGVGKIPSLPQMPQIRFQLQECGAAAVRQVLERIKSGNPSGNDITGIPGLFFIDDKLIP